MFPCLPCLVEVHRAVWIQGPQHHAISVAQAALQEKTKRRDVLVRYILFLHLPIVWTSKVVQKASDSNSHCINFQECYDCWKECLSSDKIAGRHYHASMTPDEREKTQYDWTHGKVQIIAATIAFGMGMLVKLSFHVVICRLMLCSSDYSSGIIATTGWQDLYKGEKVDAFEVLAHDLICKASWAQQHFCTMFPSTLQASTSQMFALSSTTQFQSPWKAITR